MEEKKSKKGIIIGITSLLLVTLILLGLTYAYYRTRIVGNDAEKSISVTSKKMEVTYQDGTATLSMEGNIEPGFTATKTFYVTNTGDQDVKYSVILDEMTNEYMRNQDWKVTLTKNGEEVISEDDNVYLAVGRHQVLLGSVSIAAPTDDTESKDTYVLTVTYVNEETIDQSEDMGSELTFRVNISEESYTWEDAPSGSLLYALKANQPTGTKETTPGQEASTEAEARILETEDDYGTSYVYRGNVTNNYINYSGMCWRIVRVQGDGSIKLALADENGECNAATYSTSNTISAFVDGSTDIEYNTSAAWNSTDLIFETSNIPSTLSRWAEKNNLDMSQLIQTEWCNDTANTSITYYDSDNNKVEEGSSEIADNYTTTNRGTFDRIYPVTSANPSLKCNTKGIKGTTGTDAKATRYKNVLGILSVDEVAFAGSTGWFSGGTWNNYLQINANGNQYWTLSPNDYEEEYGPSMYVITLNGTFSAIEFADSSNEGNEASVRPSVVLRSDVLLDTTITGQVGTQSNPYVIG